MIPCFPGKLTDEAGRLAALRRYDVLDTVPEAEFEEITSLVKTIFRTPMAAISLIDDDRQWFKSRRGIGIAETPRDQAFCHFTIKSNAPFTVENAAADARFVHNPLVTGAPGIRAYLGAPLSTPEGYNIGTLCVIDVAPRAFSEADAALLERFASLVVTQLELRQIASQDVLTGAMSRRAIEEQAHKELARHKRSGAPVDLVIFDLDHFKSINDAHGHLVGDEVLRRVVGVCRAALRETDCIGRLGGEEFALIFADAGPEGAACAVERLRAAVESAVLPDRPEIAFTASFGVAGCSALFGTAADWIGAADAALYAAKRAGRNCCRTAPPPRL